MPSPDEEKCVLCGQSGEADKASNHLRHIFVGNDGKLLRGYFRPRQHLTCEEVAIVKAKGGHEQPICSNRRACQRRRESRQ